MKSGAAGLRRARGRLGPCDRGGPAVAGRFHAAARGAAPLSSALGCCDRRRPWSLGSGGSTGGIPPACFVRRCAAVSFGARPASLWGRAALAGVRPAPPGADPGRTGGRGRRTAPAGGQAPCAASHRHARKGRPVAPAPWRSCARSERARRAGPAAGMARHRPSRAVCPPLRGQGGLGGAFRPPGKDNDGVRPACRGAMR